MPIQVKASFWFLICSFLQKGIVVITTPIFTRIMTTHEYGQFGVFNSWMSMISTFVTLNLYAGMYTRGLVKYKSQKKEFSSSLQSLVFCMTVFWIVVYYIFQDAINKYTSLTTPQTLCMLVLIWTTSVYNFWAAEQRVELHYKSLVVLTLLISILKPTLGIILVKYAQDKVTARIVSLVVVETVFFSWCFVSQMRKGRKIFVRQFWKEAFLFNVPLIPHYLSMSILNGADKIMIERMVGSSESGIYNLAYQISQVMLLFNSALIQTIEPWLYKKINDGETDDIKNIAYPSWLFIAVMNLLLICFAPEIVRLFAPSEYIQAIWVIPPIAMSVFFIFQYAFFAVFEFYYTKTKLAAVATCTGALLNILLNYIFIGKYGYYAAGYTTLFCYIIYAVMHYLFMRRIVREESYENNVYSFKTMFIMAIGFLTSGFIIMLTYNNLIIRYLLIIIGALTVLYKRKKIAEFVRKIMLVRKSK